MKIPRQFFQNPNVRFEIWAADGRCLYGGDNILDGICEFYPENREVYSFRPVNSGVFDFWIDSEIIWEILDHKEGTA